MNRKTLLIGLLALGMAFGTFGAVGCSKENGNSSGGTDVSDGENKDINTDIGETPDDTGGNTDDKTDTGDNTEQNVAVTGVELKYTTYSLAVGESVELEATVLPENATNKNVSWATSNADVATVSDGTVTAIAAGTAVITVTTEDGAKAATCTVTVKESTVSVTGVTLDKTECSLTVGESVELAATVLTENATNKNVSWATSNADVATVSDGTVTAIAAGTAVISITTEDGAKTATCTVTVTAAEETPKEDTVAVTGVELKHATYTLTVGDSAVLTANISPSNATNQNVSWATSNADVATVSDGTVTAIAAGTAEITVTTEDGEKTAKCIVTVTAASAGEATLSYNYAGYECAAFEWEDGNPAGATVKYRKNTQTNYTTLDSELIRSASASGYARADVVGLEGGATYEFIITTSSKEQITTTQAITAYDRSGYAHFNYTSGVGAYNDDGTLKSDATVIYLTESNKNNVDGKGSSIAEYLAAAKNNSSPIVIRVIGTVGCATWKKGNVTYTKTTSNTKDGKGAELLPSAIVGANGTALAQQNWSQEDLISGGYNVLDTSVYAAIDGLNSKIKWDSSKEEFDSCWNDCSVQYLSNVTLEGIGEDARIFQWGFTWKNCNSIEVRNLTFEDYTEDACSFEGSDTSAKAISDFNYTHFWFHHNTVEQGINYWDVCSEQDKHEGDGGTDFKGVAYVTLSYNTYHENHKTGLIGGGDSQTTACVTFHHNYYNACVSRLPLARQANMHMYNNYYYDSTGTNMSLRAGAYAFIENCYFENANNPIDIQTKKDSNGTVTTSGAAKLCGNIFSGKQYTSSSYIYEASRDTTVTNYNIFSQDFDTDSSVFYYDSTNKCSSVTVMLTAAQTKTLVPLLAGVQKRNGTVLDGSGNTDSGESSTAETVSLKADDYTADSTFMTDTNDLFTLTNSSSSAKYTVTALESAGGSTIAYAADNSGLTFSSALLPSAASNVSMTVTAKKAISITVYYTVSNSAFNTTSQSKSGYLQWSVNDGTTQSDSNTDSKDGRTAYAVTISLSSGDSVVLTSSSNRLVIFGITAVES